MGVAQAVRIEGSVQRFRFQLTDTIGDIAIVVRQLEKSGRAPHLRFVGLSNEEISGVEVLGLEPAIELTPAGRNAIEEMAVAGVEDNGEVLLPDPAERQRAMDRDVRWAGISAETEVYFDGNWTTWGELAGNEKSMCIFNDDGVLVGGYPI
jgi:hypothetical protein